MCLVIVAFRQHADFPLIVAGNRDESHTRPTQPAHWWPDQPDILAGRDLQAGGSWLAVERHGRFATVTNFREPDSPRRLSHALPRSRGHLVVDAVARNSPPIDYLRALDLSLYAGFNLFAGTATELAFVSNRGVNARDLPAGLYGLGNAGLDEPSSKVDMSKQAVRKLIETGRVNETELLRVLADRTRADVAQVAAGNLPFALAHALTAPFIIAPDYGTRSSTVLLFGKNGNVRFIERRFDADGSLTGESKFSFEAASHSP